MSDDVRDSLIPYDEIVQDALRAVVGRVLSQIEGSDHLPGEHHFYITFKTQAPGVSIPAHLVAKFPDEMTIVLQNRFWDLKVEEDLFSVGLSFNQTPSTLVIPRIECRDGGFRQETIGWRAPTGPPAASGNIGHSPGCWC